MTRNKIRFANPPAPRVGAVAARRHPALARCRSDALRTVANRDRVSIGNGIYMKGPVLSDILN